MPAPTMIIMPMVIVWVIVVVIIIHLLDVIAGCDNCRGKRSNR